MVMLLAVDIFYYFGTLGSIFDIVLLLIVLVIGLARFVYQIKIATGLIENFAWNN
jgi:hypothetical protein